MTSQQSLAKAFIVLASLSFSALALIALQLNSTHNRPCSLSTINHACQ